jgi:hypothetical protein
MLERLSDRIRECYDRAAEAKAQADAASDPALKAEYLNAERRWLTLARSLDSLKGLKISPQPIRNGGGSWRIASNSRGRGLLRPAKATTGRRTYSNCMRSARC